jgi:hypothetical protein
MEFDNLAGAIDADAPPAPCDFARLYRGKVGESPCSLALSRVGSKLSGFAAYDAGSGDIEVAGQVEPDGALGLSEVKDGKKLAELRGTCAPDTGVITGRWKRAGAATDTPFTLHPREAGGVPLGEHRRRFGVLIEDTPSCHWDVRSPVVFGQRDAERTRRINAALRVRFTGGDEAGMERLVNNCGKGDDRHVLGWYSVEMSSEGVLSVLENGYTYFGPAVHGDFTAAARVISIDIPTGRTLALRDVVTSSKALRPVVTSCMKLVAEKLGGGDEWWFERDIQGVPCDKLGDPVAESSPEFVPSSLREPSFLVLPDGIAVLIRNQPTVSAAIELSGPVLRWGALLRAGVLKAGSPLARLWAKEKPLGAQEPACVRFFEPKWSTPRPAKKDR